MLIHRSQLFRLMPVLLGRRFYISLHYVHLFVHIVFKRQSEYTVTNNIQVELVSWHACE